MRRVHSRAELIDWLKQCWNNEDEDDLRKVAFYLQDAELAVAVKAISDGWDKVGTVIERLEEGPRD